MAYPHITSDKRIWHSGSVRLVSTQCCTFKVMKTSRRRRERRERQPGSGRRHLASPGVRLGHLCYVRAQRPALPFQVWTPNIYLFQLSQVCQIHSACGGAEEEPRYSECERKRHDRALIHFCTVSFCTNFKCIYNIKQSTIHRMWYLQILQITWVQWLQPDESVTGDDLSQKNVKKNSEFPLLLPEEANTPRRQESLVKLMPRNLWYNTNSLIV